MASTGIRSSAIIIRENKILLIHRKKNGQEYWTFPGGGVEEGETESQAVIREVKEETNLHVQSVKLAFTNDIDGNKHLFYFCEVNDGDASLGGEEKEKNSEENSYELEWIDLIKLNELNLVPENAKQKILKLAKIN